MTLAELLQQSHRGRTQQEQAEERSIYFAHKAATWAEFCRDSSMLHSVPAEKVQRLEAGII